MHLPKKEEVEGISDYRPISLIHVIPKIIVKVISIHLGPHMNTLVSNIQEPLSRG